MKKYNLVIVENDEDERVFMKMAFEQSGNFQVLGDFVTGDSLIEWLEAGANPYPELVLSDLNMPGKNGYDILKWFKSDPALAHIPVFITSTSNLETFRERCLAAGAADYLVKPDLFVDYQQYADDLYQILLTRNLI